jgi:hypothetical protein
MTLFMGRRDGIWDPPFPDGNSLDGTLLTIFVVNRLYFSSRLKSTHA